MANEQLQAGLTRAAASFEKYLPGDIRDEMSEAIGTVSAKSLLSPSQLAGHVSELAVSSAKATMLAKLQHLIEPCLAEVEPKGTLKWEDVLPAMKMLKDAATISRVVDDPAGFVEGLMVSREGKLARQFTLMRLRPLLNPSLEKELGITFEVALPALEMPSLFPIDELHEWLKTLLEDNTEKEKQRDRESFLAQLLQKDGLPARAIVLAKLRRKLEPLLPEGVTFGDTLLVLAKEPAIRVADLREQSFDPGQLVTTFTRRKLERARDTRKAHEAKLTRLDDVRRMIKSGSASAMGPRDLYHLMLSLRDDEISNTDVSSDGTDGDIDLNHENRNSNNERPSADVTAVAGNGSEGKSSADGHAKGIAPSPSDLLNRGEHSEAVVLSHHSDVVAGSPDETSDHYDDALGDGSYDSVIEKSVGALPREGVGGKDVSVLKMASEALSFEATATGEVTQVAAAGLVKADSGGQGRDGHGKMDGKANDQVRTDGTSSGLHSNRFRKAAPEANLNDIKILVNRLELDIKGKRLETLFALCDKDGNGRVSEEEFVANWEAAVRQHMLSVTEGVGLSQVQVRDRASRSSVSSHSLSTHIDPSRFCRSSLSFCQLCSC